MNHPERAPISDVPISDDMIRLGQFLKLAGVLDTGGEIKEMIAAGDVLVNGEPEERRGRQLHRGDVVAAESVEGHVERFRVV